METATNLLGVRSRSDIGSFNIEASITTAAFAPRPAALTRCRLGAPGPRLSFGVTLMSVSTSTAPSMGMSTGAPFGSAGNRASQTLTPPNIEKPAFLFGGAEGGQNALDMSRLGLVTEEFLRLLILRGFLR